jgi:hypothetical protein
MGIGVNMSAQPGSFVDSAAASTRSLPVITSSGGGMPDPRFAARDIWMQPPGQVAVALG